MNKIDPTVLQQLGEQLMDYLSQQGYEDFALYLNDQSWSLCDIRRATHTTAAGTHYCVRENVSAEEECRFFRSGTVNMIFDGKLYEALNYGNGSVNAALQDILRPYDLYFEMGYPFSMTACPV